MGSASSTRFFIWFLLFLGAALWAFDFWSGLDPVGETWGAIVERASADLPKRPSAKNFQELGFKIGSMLAVVVFGALSGLMALSWFLDRRSGGQSFLSRWSRPLDGEAPDLPGAASKGMLSGRAYALIVIVLILVGLYPRIMRMSQSYWTDEDWMHKLYAIGECLPHQEITDPGESAFEKGQLVTQDALRADTKLAKKEGRKPATARESESLYHEDYSWLHTLSSQKNANNHVFFTALQRLSIRAWQRMTGEPSYRFEEWVARLPSFVSGVVMLGLVGLLFNRIGWREVGVVAVLYLSIHPWGIRYASEAKGYGLSLACLALALWAITGAMRKGRWIDWALVALGQFGVLYAFAGAAFTIVLMSLGLLIACWGTDRTQFLPQAYKWFVTNCVTGSLFLLLMLPGMIEMKFFVTGVEELGIKRTMLFTWDMKWGFVKDIVSKFFIGVPSHAGESGVSVGRTFAGDAVLWGVVAFSVCSWLYVLARFRTRLAYLLLASLGSLAAFYSTKAQGLVIYPQYTSPGLIPVAMLNSIFLWQGLEWLCGKLSKRDATADRSYQLAWGGTLAVMMAMLGFLWPRIHLLCTQPLEDIRGACEIGRWKHEEPYCMGSSNVETISIWRDVRTYDPRLNIDRVYRDPVEGVPALRRKVDECRAGDRELYFMVGNLSLAERNSVNMLEYLESSGDFELVRQLEGQEPTFTLKLYRMRKVMLALD